MSRARQVVLWWVAAAVVAGAHLAVLDWLAPRAIGAPMQALPPAVEIELIAPPDVDPAVADAPVAPALPATDPPSPAPQPVLDLPPLIPLPPPVFKPVPVPEAAVAPPPARPKSDPPRKAEKPKPTPPKPAPPKPTTPQKSSDRPSADAARGGAKATARPAGPATGASPGAMADWQGKVMGQIAAHMARTRASGRGKAVPIKLAVTIGANGQVSATLAGSTGDAGLDAAIRRQAARIPRMPPPPDRRPFSFTRTIRVQFR